MHWFAVDGIRYYFYWGETIHRKYTLQPSQIGPKYAFICKISSAGKRKSGSKRAVIIVPQALADKVMGYRAIVTIELLEDSKS